MAEAVTEAVVQAVVDAVVSKAVDEIWDTESDTSGSTESTSGSCATLSVPDTSDKPAFIWVSRTYPDYIYPNPKFQSFMESHYVTREGFHRVIKTKPDLAQALEEAKRQGGMLRVAGQVYRGSSRGRFDQRLIPQGANGPTERDMKDVRAEIEECKKEVRRGTETLQKMLYLVEMSGSSAITGHGSIAEPAPGYTETVQGS